MTQFNFGCHHKFVYSNGVVLCERCGQFPSKGTGTFDGTGANPRPYDENIFGWNTGG